MTLLLGVDTGGTYTDAVLLRDEREVVASAKALTTRHDLAIGIGAAVEAVLRESGADVSEIGLASLSTTLATNALVEGQGGRAGLVYIGFGEADLRAHGLSEALGGDPVIVLRGGHDHAGGEATALDKDALRAWLESETGASAYAVAAQFATRNPAHELAAAEMIREVTGRPVSLSHHLSAKLNGPKRALTALLNARLIGMIARLIDKTEGKLRDLGIAAPLMVVRDAGHVVLTGSLSGFRGLPGAIGYAASKAAVMALAESMQADLWRTGVRVQLANPGFIKTRLTEKNDFRMPFLMTPDEAAQEMFELMCDEGRFARHFPRLFSYVFRLSRFLPGWVYYRLFA